MIYEYICYDCKIIIEADFPMGEASETVPCSDCKKECNRNWSGIQFAMRDNKKFKREMTERNKRAEQRMNKNRKDRVPKLVAYEKGGKEYSKRELESH